MPIKSRNCLWSRSLLVSCVSQTKPCAGLSERMFQLQMRESENEMLTATRYRLTEARGFECASHNLVMFGGAGGQHGCSIANTLGIKRVIVPRLSSLLSAYGMALADVVREVTEPAAITVKDTGKIIERISALSKTAEDDLLSQGFSSDRIVSEKYLNCRYQGTSTQLMIEEPQDGNWGQAFYEEHKQQFGFNLDERDILVDDFRVRGVGRSVGYQVRSPHKDFVGIKKRPYESDKFETTKVVPLLALKDGDQVRVGLEISHLYETS